MLFDVIFSMVSTVLSGSIILLIQNLFQKKTLKQENEEIKIAVDDTIAKIQNSENVIDLMVKNVAELKEYYVISKQQAHKSFSSAVFVCVLGFLVFIVGLVINYFDSESVIMYSTIAGSIVEVISVLFFGLYRSSIKQLNLYHQRLGVTEKYLTAIQLIEKLSPDIKDEQYTNLIKVILADNSSILRNKGNAESDNTP